MIVSHYELEKEMHRRQCDIEQTAREELKFQEEKRKTKITNKGLRNMPFLNGLLQMMKKIV
jgi:hypothetical protein